MTRFWPIIFIIGIWFIFASPYFLKGLVPYASTYQVNFFVPWSHYEKFWGPVKNNAMPDVHTQIYPWKKFTIETFQGGQVPYWNPYNFSGNPHLANVQSAVLSPFNLLFFAFSFIDAWSILVLLQPLLAALFMYLFLKSLNISQVGSLVGSIAFMFCGFIVVWMAYATLAYAILYLLLALFAIEKYSQTRRFRFLLLLTPTIPLSFFSGHFQISLYFLLTVVAYILFKAFTTRKSFFILHSSFFILLGLVFSLPQLLPSIELYRHSVRSELFQISEAIPIQYLITIIAPDFLGNPVTRNDWFGHYAEWAGFIGIWPLALALYAVINRNKTIVFFAVIGILSLLLAVNSPLSSLLISLKIPVISTSALSRIIVLFSFSFAVLAGFGFDRLRNDLEKTRAFKKIFIILFSISIVLAGVWVILLLGQFMPAQWLIVAKRNFILPTVLFAFGSLLLLTTIRNKKSVLVVAYYVLLATSFDSLRFAQKWMPFDPKELVYSNVPVIDAMREHIGDGRVFGNIGEATVVSYYGFPSIEGYDPLYIRRYGELLRSAGNGTFLEAERSVAKLPRDGKYTDRVLDLLGVRLIFHPIADTNQVWAYPVWRDKERYSLVYQDDKFQLFRNNRALPRAAIFFDYEVVSDETDIVKRFYSDDFDFRKKLILEEDPKLSSSSEGQGSAHIVSYKPNHVMIEVETSQPGLLFLADNYYPGWKAYIDESQTKVYRANYTFRAVAVPAGKSTVEFTYENWHL